MAESKYSLEQYYFFSDCNEIGMTAQETLDAFEEDYEQIGILTKRAVEMIRYRTDKWIYMLRDVMTAEEALEDYYNYIIEHPEINWKDNPKYLQSVIDTVGDSIRDAMYKFFTQHDVRITQRIISRQRSRALAVGKIKKEDANRLSFFLPYKLIEDKIHPDHYITHGNDSVFNAETPVSVTCYALGHETIKDSMVKVYYTGCGECLKLKVGTGVLYSEEYFKEHPEVAKSLGVLYLILLTHEEEIRIPKVGIAKGNIKTAVDKRYKYNSCAPYVYELEDIIVGTTIENWRLEQYLLLTLYPRKGPLQYKPNFKFGGHTECIVPEKTEELKEWFKKEKARRAAK